MSSILLRPELRIVGLGECENGELVSKLPTCVQHKLSEIKPSKYSSQDEFKRGRSKHKDEENVVHDKPRTTVSTILIEL